MSLRDIAAIRICKKVCLFSLCFANPPLFLWRDTDISFVKHVDEIKFVDLSNLSSVLFAKQRCAAVVAENHTSRLRLAVAAESLKQKRSLNRQEGPGGPQALPPVGTVQLSKVSENGAWHPSWLVDVMRPFNTLSSLSDVPGIFEWAFIRNKSQSRDLEDQQFKMKRSSSTNYEMEKALE